MPVMRAVGMRLSVAAARAVGFRTMKILVTGGAGYIGSHTVLELLAHGHDVEVLDNFDNSSAESIRRVEKLAGRDVPLYELDLRDEAAVTALFAEGGFDSVIHFA